MTHHHEKLVSDDGEFFEIAFAKQLIFLKKLPLRLEGKVCKNEVLWHGAEIVVLPCAEVHVDLGAAVTGTAGPRTSFVLVRRITWPVRDLADPTVPSVAGVCAPVVVVVAGGNDTAGTGSTTAWTGAGELEGIRF